MTRISTHVLDIAQGQPARNLPVRLERQESNRDWRLLASAKTDQDGRCVPLPDESDALTPGIYRLRFDTETYFGSHKIDSLYPAVEVTFRVRDGEQHFHIPLLLSPHGYTTYRGS
jgi:5-hydroxyisourate hydrolase